MVYKSLINRVATPEGFEPSTTRLEGCSEVSNFKVVSQITPKKYRDESQRFNASVKPVDHGYPEPAAGQIPLASPLVKIGGGA